MLTVHNFSYGPLTPALAYLMSFVGSFLGLRCTSRARASTGSARRGWLLVASVSFGVTGIWVMHFIAMLGFSIPGQTIEFNVPITLGSMVIAVAFVSLGLMIVGFGPAGNWSLAMAGVVMGLGIAAMHYTGMAAMQAQMRMSYNPVLFVLSVVIAIVASTAALWAALRLSTVWSTLLAAGIMGVAVSSMHYVGVAAMHTLRAPVGAAPTGGADATAFLLPLIIGVSVLTFVLTATIALSPSEAEINAEAELMQRISTARAAQLPMHGSAAPVAPPPREARWRPPAGGPPATGQLSAIEDRRAATMAR